MPEIVMPHCPVTAIAGGSASGKSTLVQTLLNRFPSSIAALPLDRYYHDLSHLPLHQRAHTNFDHPNALDIRLFVRHLQSLSGGESIEAPVYDFATHTRQGSLWIEPQPFIITEGILLLAIAEIRECIDFSVFLDVPEPVRLERKIKRDTTERSRTERYAREQFFTTVKPVHDELVIPSMQYADLVLDGTLPTDELVERVMTKTRDFLMHPTG